MSVLQKIIEERKKTIPKPSDFNTSDLVATDCDVLMRLKRKDDKPSLIAELKRSSPTLGQINANMTVSKAVNLYSPYASALSILTEPNFFGGSTDDLAEARTLTELPLLRKDFITDPLQIKEARHFGADFYLLIVAALSKHQLAELLEVGLEYNMPALVEVHDEKEMEDALESNAQIIGINNRNLSDLSIDMKTTERILDQFSNDIDEQLIISESGFKAKEDLLSLPEKVEAVLIGSTFMKSEQPETLLADMFG